MTSLADAALIPVSVAGFGVLAGATSVAVACAVCGGGFLLQLLYSLNAWWGGEGSRAREYPTFPGA